MDGSYKIKYDGDKDGDEVHQSVCSWNGDRTNIHGDEETGKWSTARDVVNETNLVTWTARTEPSKTT